MNEPLKEDSELEYYIQKNSSLPTLSNTAKDKMLAAVGLKSRSSDYTWKQFFVRLGSLAAGLICCLSIFNALRSLESSDEHPVNNINMQQPNNYASSQFTPLATQHYKSTNNESQHTLLYYMTKGYPHDHK